MTEAIQVITTAPTRLLADQIARELVARHLAACVQVTGPIASTYRWQGAIETSEEWQCTIKTVHANYSAVEAAIRELHSYDVPEILAFSVVVGNAAYLAWLKAETHTPVADEDSSGQP